MTREVNTEEINTENKIKRALQETQTPLKLIHGKALVHPEDL